MSPLIPDFDPTGRLAEFAVNPLIGPISAPDGGAFAPPAAILAAAGASAVTRDPAPQQGLALDADGRVPTSATPRGLVPIINVRDYGAVGNYDPATGTGTDDTTAIRAAITDAPDYATIVFPQAVSAEGALRRYKITDALDLSSKVGLTIAGMSGLGVTYPFPSSLIAVGFSANTPMLKIAPGSATDVQMFIRDLFLDCNSSAEDGIYAIRASSVRVHRVTVRSATRSGIRFERGVSDASNNECENCYVNGATVAAYYNETIYSRFDRAHSDSGQYSLYLADQAANALVEGCHLEGATVAGIYLAGSAGGSRILANQVVITTGSATVRGIHSDSATAGDLKIIGNSVVGPESGTVGQRGIGVDVSGPKSLIQGNTIAGFDTSIGANAASLTVSGNICTTASTTSISVNHAGNATLITGNTLLDAAASVAITAGTVSGANNYFAGTVPTQIRERGYQFSHVEFTGNVTVSATTEGAANTVATADAVTFDGATPVLVEFFTPFVELGANAAGNVLRLVLFDGSSAIGQIGTIGETVNTTLDVPVLAGHRLTPSAAAHTYSVRAYRTNANCTVVGGAGGAGVNMPGYIRIART